MSCKKGFKLKVNNHEYFVVCDFAQFKKDHNWSMVLSVKVFVDGKETEPRKIDAYAKEKISDYIENTINGQDTLYWDWDGMNRHLDKNLMPTQKSKDKPSFSEYLKKFYSKHSLSTNKKKRVIVSAGRGIF